MASKTAKAERHRTQFGQRMWEARNDACLSLEAAAQKIGVSVSTLSQAENTGQGTALIFQFADLYGVSARWLALGEGPKVTPTQSDDEKLRLLLSALKSRPKRLAFALAMCEMAAYGHVPGIDEEEVAPPRAAQG